MVGREIDNDNAMLVAAVQATGHAGRFTLLGERTDVPSWLDAMDLFALPSMTEGFPNVVGEAMAMAVPCVVTDVGDAAMLVGSTGRVVPPQQPVQLGKAMEVLARMPPDERRALGLQARARVVAEFSLRRACDRFSQLQASVVTDVAESGRES
jgi:glycosyltransferase involved in cell wall biosynthesis